MFHDFKTNQKMIEGAYKKLKSFLYFDKTSIYAKEKLARFESDRIGFNRKIKELSVMLEKRNEEYFDSFIKNISFKVQPKSFASSYDSSDVVYGVIDHNKKIKKINFFIDMPIELYILDCLWAVLLGKIYNEHKNSSSAATAFKKSLYKEATDLVEGIDWESNRLFEPYYGLYTKWRDDAFDTIDKAKDETNTVLVCLDLKSFYYSVEFDFAQLKELLYEDRRINEFRFLTKIMEKIYRRYTEFIVEYKGLKVHGKNKNVFPIGLMSTFVLREVYMADFDTNILNVLKPRYYSRYVDDILLVLSVGNDQLRKKNEIIKLFLLNTGLLKKSKSNELRFTKYPNLRIQREKINCFLFVKNEGNILINVYKEIIRKNSSEGNLLPDVNILNSTFTSNAYNIQNLDLSNKIRDLGFLQNNNLKATRFITSLQKIIKCTNYDGKQINEYLNQVEECYRGSQCLEFSNNWKSIFELFLLCNENQRAKNFYSNVLIEINNKIDFDDLGAEEIKENKKCQLLKTFKENMKEKLKIAFALACSLNNEFSGNKDSFEDIKELALCFRKSNMLNHGMVAYPLLNYTKNNSVTLSNMHWIKNNDFCDFKLENFKVKFSPRFISSIEFYMFYFIQSLCLHAKDKSMKWIYENYVKVNNLMHSNEVFLEQKSISDVANISCDSIRFLHKGYGKKKNKNCKIGLVNTKITEHNVLKTIFNPQEELTFDNKARIFNVLNEARKQKVNFVVFPEFYFPIEWLTDVANFAVKNNIAIISGVRYIAIGKTIFNNICNVVPVSMGRSFFAGILLFREKNFYAPSEKDLLNKFGFSCEDADTPKYLIVDNGEYKYSTILCYEFTDIFSRANMKGLVELLFIPQLNQDTNYFSSIVESSARDLHCFVVQANTSIYGDSRITAPYKSVHKNVLQIKGGDTDVLLVSEIDIAGLKTFRNDYIEQFNITMKDCFNCSKIKESFNGDYNDICKKCCGRSSESEKLKGLPANFRLER